MLLVQNLSEPT